jgi:FkbM family methyltransferase
MKHTLPESIIHLLAKNRKKFPVRFVSELAKKFVRGCENYSYNGHLNGEDQVLQKLSPLNLEVFFDVGANRGIWSIMVRRFFPTSSLHCFEIAPPMHEILDRVLKQLNPPINMNKFGLSDHSGSVEFCFCPEEDGLSTLLPAFLEEGRYVKLEVPVETGDSYAKKNSIKRIDFLKLDVEGAENLVLNGFSEMLRRGAIRVIQFEYGKTNITAGFLLKDFYHLLEPLGYSIGKIFPDGVEFKSYSHEDENFIGPNFLAIQKNEQDLIKRLTA